VGYQLYLEREEEQRDASFFLYFFCLSAYYALLRIDFTEYVFRAVFCAAKSFSPTVLVLSALQEASRRPFWYFHRCKKFPDDRFGTSIAARTFPTTVLAFPSLQEASRRPFWCFLRCRKN